MVAAFAQGIPGKLLERETARSITHYIAAGDSPYIDDCHIATAAPHATDPELAEKLWMLSEEIVGQKFML